MCKKTITLLSALVLALTVLHAQDRLQPMDLRACMAYAVEHATDMAVQRAATADARLDRRSAILAAFTPAVSSSTYAYYNFGRSIDPETNTYRTVTSFHNGYNAAASFTLFDGFSAINNLRIAKTAVLMGRSEEQQVRDRICLAVMEAYFNVLYYEEMVRAVETQVGSAEEALRKAVKQEEVGQKGHADVIQMEADLADRQYLLINTRNSLADARMTLKDLMLWPVDEELPVGGPLTTVAVPDISPYDPDGTVDFALAHNPVAVIAEGNLRTARLNLRTARWQLLPSITLYGGLSTTYYTYPHLAGYDPVPYRDQLRNNMGEYVQLSVSIPIYSHLSQQTRIAKMKNACTKAQAQYDKTRRDLESEVRRAVADRDGAAAAFEQARHKAAVQEEAYAFNTQKFEQGLISPIEYQTAAGNYLSAQADRLHALFTLYIKDSVVQYYNGIDYLQQ